MIDRGSGHLNPSHSAAPNAVPNDDWHSIGIRSVMTQRDREEAGIDNRLAHEAAACRCCFTKSFSKQGC